ELRDAWVRWSIALQKISLLERHLSQLDEIVRLAEVQRQANRIGVPELRVLQMERANRAGELALLRIDEQRARLAIASLLGLHPDAPLELQPAVSVEPFVGTASLDAQLREHNLELAIARAEYEVADRALRVEIRKQ